MNQVSLGEKLAFYRKLNLNRELGSISVPKHNLSLKSLFCMNLLDSCLLTPVWCFAVWLFILNFLFNLCVRVIKANG
jgi:hypothetical protein